MNIEFMGKGSLAQLGDLVDIGFKKAELYIRNRDDLSKTIKNIKLEIEQVHEFKGNFNLNGKKIWGNIANPGLVGSHTEELIKEHIDFLKKNDIDKLVLHGGFINKNIADKDFAIETLAKRLDKLNDKDITFCVENSGYLPKITEGESERVIVSLSEIKKLRDMTETDVKFLIDIEHTYNSVFNKVYV